jgi:hypothetical protein|uniref:Poly(A) polymerase catalytic subunit domain-containing protein n=1 Tax=viral metagenome TaxID=1070528 RepID=A0A6C0IPA1_9ZZZZ
MNSNDKLTFEEKELSILRDAVDRITSKQGRQTMNSPEVINIIEIVENFLRDTKRICYGGTAINNLLPRNDQFYNKEIELPDYDFYSPEPLKDAKILADIYYDKGYTEVEAKSGMHAGTFKVFVNYIPVADITYLPKELYDRIMKDSSKVNGIYYCAINYLRMSMYLELSRPDGDVSRWEKVLKRLSLFNKHYPLRGKKCNIDEIQRLFEYGLKKTIMKGGNVTQEDIFINNIEERIFITTKNSLINQNCVFFGAYANRLYLKNINTISKKSIPKIPDFDVLSEEPETTARILKEQLSSIGVKDIKIIKHDGIGEIIAPHYEIKIGPESIVFIYKPLACHSYNELDIKGKTIRIATLDTMLSFYLAFLYGGRKYYNIERITCMSEFLYRVQEKNRLQQKGLLKRFSINCYGKQHSMEDIKSEKTKNFNRLKGERGSKEWNWYFLRYVPHEENEHKFEKKDKKKKNVKKKKRKKKTKKGKKSKKQKNVKRKTKKRKKSNIFGIQFK